MVAALLLLGALGVLTPRRAFAQTTLTLLPRVGVGVTNNPTGLPGQAHWDEMLHAGANAQVDYDAAKTTQGLGYQIAYIHFLHATQADSLSNQLAWVSTYRLAAAWQLGLGAAAILTRTSMVVTTADLTPAAPPQAAVGGDTLYFTSNAAQTLTYSPKPTQTYRQALRAQYLEYLRTAGAPATVVVGGTLGADWARGLNAFSADVGATGASTQASEPTTFPTGDLFLVEATGSWRRELGASWASVLRGGGAVITSHGDTVFEPLVLASIEYRRDLWFATLSASQQVTPNLFTGGITVNDQAVLQGAVPLDRRELVVLSGHGSYTHARPVAQGPAALAFDQWMAAAGLIGHLPQLPLWMSLEYTLIDQINKSATTPVPDLLRHTLMLSIGGTFRWGAPPAPPAGG